MKNRSDEMSTVINNFIKGLPDGAAKKAFHEINTSVESLPAAVKDTFKEKIIEASKLYDKAMGEKRANARADKSNMGSNIAPALDKHIDAVVREMLSELKQEVEKAKNSNNPAIEKGEKSSKASDVNVVKGNKNIIAGGYRTRPRPAVQSPVSPSEPKEAVTPNQTASSIVQTAAPSQASNAAKQSLGTIKVEITGMENFLNEKKAGPQVLLLGNTDKKVTFDKDDNMIVTQKQEGSVAAITASAKTETPANDRNQERKFEGTIYVEIEIKKKDEGVYKDLAHVLKAMTRDLPSSQVVVKSVDMGSREETTTAKMKLNAALKGEGVLHLQRQKSLESVQLPPSWTADGKSKVASQNVQASVASAKPVDASEVPPSPGKK